MAARIAATRSCVRRGSEEPVLKTVRRRHHADQISGTPAVHRNSIGKVGVSIKERRADPELRCPGILLDRSDPAILDHDINRPKRELLTKQSLTGHNMMGIHGMS